MQNPMKNNFSKARIMRALGLFCILPVIAFAQNYFEASGQTTIFNLVAGATAGWDSPSTSSERIGAMPSYNAFRISMAGNGLVIHAGAKGIIKLLDIRGRMVTTVAVAYDGFVPLSRGMANGVYVARFEAPGFSVKTARLAVVR